MKVSEAIDQLKDGDAVWVKGMVDVVYKGWHPGINIREVGWFYENTEISLTEPQAERVEIPQLLADYFNNNPNLSIGGLLAFDVLDWDREDEVSHWLYGNDIAENNKRYLIACKAYVNGYTVEQPKQWVVRQGGYLQGFRISLDGDIVKQWGIYEGCIKFTDKPKAEAVATLVEGTVEEV